MIAIIYLILCFLTGYVICSFTIPNLSDLTGKTYLNHETNLAKGLLTLPVYFLTGTIFVTWTTYVFAIIFQHKAEPLRYANAVTMCVFLVFSLVGTYFIKVKGKNKSLVIEKKHLSLEDGIFIGIVTFLSIQLMWASFYIYDGQLNVGYSVFSDFSPHIGMIRSFSAGNNFPTRYSHFAAEDIRYHFMFQFLVGNLEYLGLRLDLAMNIPSIIGLTSSFLLLFVLAVKLSGKKAVGYLSCLFFAFRSSKTFFTFLANVPEGTSLFTALNENINFIGSTPNEEWGLWNLNVYCNQRHLAFTIPILLFVIILYIPSVYESYEQLQDKLKKISETAGGLWYKVVLVIRHCFFTKECWQIKSLSQTIFIGILVGALAFWNGAVTITILTILFVMAFVANRKLEYLIIAVISVALSFLQSSIFIQGSTVSTKFQFGFLAENRTIFGALDYIMRLTGILPLVLITAFLVVKRSRRYMMFPFFAPFVFAFCISLTPDIAVNHKYIMLSIMLLSIYAAILIVKLYVAKRFALKFISVILVVLMTVTGVYDYITVLRMNQQSIQLEMKNDLTDWVIHNCDSQDIILSSYYSLNQIVLGGGMLFLGWPYYAWSAGYDTDLRAELVKQMYEASNSMELEKLIEENKIRYIIVDKDCRDNESYVVNEANIAATYESVYEEGSDVWKLTIYDTHLRIME